MLQYDEKKKTRMREILIAIADPEKTASKSNISLNIDQEND